MGKYIFRLSAFADEAATSFEEQLAALRENSIGLIEIRGVNGKNVMELTDDEAKEAKAMLDKYGIGLSALGSPIGKIGIDDDFDPHMEKLERAFRLCRIFGTDKIRMFSFFMPKDSPYETKREEVFVRIEKMLLAAEKNGIFLLHENEKGIYGDTDERCLDLMQAFYPRMQCVFDPANFVQCGVKPAEAFPALAKYTEYIHVKDALLSDGAVVPAGKGDGGVESVLGQFLAFKDDAVLTVEPHLAVFDGLQNLQHEEIKRHYSYPDKKTAFKAACDALKEILTNLGFAEEKPGIWAK